MSRKIKLILIFIIFIIGIVILMFPFITNYLYQEKVKSIEYNYKEIIGLQNNFDSLNELLKNKNEMLFLNKQDSFINQKVSFEKIEFDLSEYGLSDNIIGFVSIPSIDIKLPIYLGASIKNMNKGAVHLTGTSYPIGGINTNSVIAAHRAYSKAKMFRDIDKINIGDYLYIENYNGILKYTAIKKEIINPNDFDKLKIVEGKDLVTIISCHPYRSSKKRYVVYFERVI